MNGRIWVATLMAVVFTPIACASESKKVAPATSSDDASYSTPGGQSVEVIHASPDALALVDWAFSRFEAADLAEPAVSRIDFAAGDPGCEEPGGWAIAGDGNGEITVCLEVHRMCRQVDGVVFTVAGRICILHELSHLWLSQYVTESGRQEFMGLTDAQSWRDPDLPWAERGVEQAADTIAWGLLGGTIEILGRSLPPCELLRDGFLMLTGAAPISDCDHFRS